MYRFQPSSHIPSNCRPVFTLRAGMMDPGDKMAYLEDILSFDPLIISQESEVVSLFERLRASLEPMELGAWQLTNGVHLALSHLVTSKLIDIREATTIHGLFLHEM